ncbi:MAG: hypothetical protein ACI86H_000553 [bacterium]|jgi:hypothetical protein
MRKKTFACGHTGLGQFCHRCRELDKRKLKNIDKKSTCKKELSNDIIDLKILPNKGMLSKARKIIQGLVEEEQDYRLYNGKRFQWDRSLISIPIGMRYRMLCKEEEGKVIPQEVMSHEKYNRYCIP